MKKTIFTLIITLTSTLSFNTYALSMKLHRDLVESNSSSKSKNAAIELNDINQTSDEYEVGDLFPGTIQFKNKRYILSRCTSGGDDYVLDFINQNDRKTIDQLISSKTKFWINIFGVYSSINDEHHLKVKDASDIHVGQSCHLRDALENLFKEE